MELNKKDDNILEWLQIWYASHCNGEWEHGEGILMATLDNPGFSITINLKDTELENLNIPSTLIDNSENDWYAFSIIDAKYCGYGDPFKLITIIEKFREIVENHSNNK